MSETPEQASRTVIHPQLGPGRLLKTYMGGYEWEVAFDSGRRFRLPAREFAAVSVSAWQTQTAPATNGFTPREPVLLSRALNQHRINLRELIRLAVVTFDLLYLHPDYTPETLLQELTKGLRL